MTSRRTCSAPRRYRRPLRPVRQHRDDTQEAEESPRVISQGPVRMRSISREEFRDRLRTSSSRTTRCSSTCSSAPTTRPLFAGPWTVRRHGRGPHVQRGQGERGRAAPCRLATRVKGKVAGLRSLSARVPRLGPAPRSARRLPTSARTLRGPLRAIRPRRSRDRPHRRPRHGHCGPFDLRPPGAWRVLLTRAVEQSLGAGAWRRRFRRGDRGCGCGGAASDFEEALYEVFQHDAHVPRLAMSPRDRASFQRQALAVFGDAGPEAIQWLTGLVRVCSLARVPGGDSRLVPCRYHFFVRGLNGAYVAFDGNLAAGDTVPRLFLDRRNTTEDGEAQTLELAPAGNADNLTSSGMPLRRREAGQSYGPLAPRERSGASRSG